MVSQVRKHPGTEGGFPTQPVKPGEVLAASLSGGQSSRTEGKAIPTQRSALSQEAHLPPRLLVKQLETVTLGAAQHGEIRRISMTKAALVWHKIRCSEVCELHDLIEHEVLNSRHLLHSVGSFFVYQYATC